MNAVLAHVALERSFFIDQSGSLIGMTREWGRAPRGQRAHGTVRSNRGTATAMIGAMDVHALRTLMTTEGATTAEVFLALVMHFLLRFSPDLDPIELLWSKPKDVLKKLGTRTHGVLDEAITNAMWTITPENAHSRIEHCGHLAQSSLSAQSDGVSGLRQFAQPLTP